MDPNSTSGRTYIVFGCSKEGCGRLPGSWRAYTFVNPKKNIPENDSKIAAELPQPPESSSAVLEWGADSLDWGDADEVNSLDHKIPPGEEDARDQPGISSYCSQQQDSVSIEADARNLPRGCNLEAREQNATQQDRNLDDLVSNLDRVLQMNDYHPARAGSQGQQPLDPGPSESSEYIQIGDKDLALPEFYLWQVPEPSAPQSHGPSKDQRHIEELLAAYEKEEVIASLSLFLDVPDIREPAQFSGLYLQSQTC